MAINNTIKSKKVEKFLEDVPISGTKEIYTSQHLCEKLLWTIFVCFCIGLTGFYIFKVFAEYKENETASKVCLRNKYSCNVFKITSISGLLSKK